MRFHLNYTYSVDILCFGKQQQNHQIKVAIMWQAASVKNKIVFWHRLYIGDCMISAISSVYVCRIGLEIRQLRLCDTFLHHQWHNHPLPPFKNPPDNAISFYLSRNLPIVLVLSSTIPPASPCIVSLALVVSRQLPYTITQSIRRPLLRVGFLSWWFRARVAQTPCLLAHLFFLHNF